jgi:hypothetical protein
MEQWFVYQDSDSAIPNQNCISNSTLDLNVVPGDQQTIDIENQAKDADDNVENRQDIQVIDNAM